MQKNTLKLPQHSILTSSEAFYEPQLIIVRQETNQLLVSHVDMNLLHLLTALQTTRRSAGLTTVHPPHDSRTGPASVSPSLSPPQDRCWSLQLNYPIITHICIIRGVATLTGVRTTASVSVSW